MRFEMRFENEKERERREKCDAVRSDLRVRFGCDRREWHHGDNIVRDAFEAREGT